MSHYAKIESGIVTNVIVAEADVIASYPGTWIKTSYNTRGNVHYAPNSNTPDEGTALRGNYAGIGDTYDSDNDVFYEQSPYASWTLNETTWLWEAPTPMPNSGGPYIWDEDTLSWVAV
jgi:hypothetical protein